METNKRFWVFKHQIIGAFAKWAVRQSPYCYPDGLEKGLRLLDSEVSKQLAWSTIGMAKLSTQDILDVLDNVVKNPRNRVFVGWNTPKKNKNVKFLFTSRYHTPKPDYDFIDLDALIRNTVTDIYRESESDAEFDRRVEQSCKVTKRRKK